MNVRDNIAAGKYENKIPYSIERVPVDDETMTVKRAREHVASEKRREQTQRRLHNEEEGRLSGLLCADLEIEHGVVGHPKAGKLWALAYEYGHSSGYSSVVNYYEEFIELISERA
jgi:hypothetical protein